MIRSELPSLFITLGLSVALHAAIFIVWSPICGCNVTVPPELIPSQVGVASIRLVASEEARPQPTEPSDVPMMAEPVPLPKMPTPKMPRIAPPRLERPREHVEVAPSMTAEVKVTTPVEVPDLPADLVPRLTTPKETVKTEAPKAQAIDRPRTLVSPSPTLTPEKRMVVAATGPELRPDLIPTPMPVKEAVKRDPAKPSVAERPKTVKVEQPKLEAETKVAELASKASPASQETQGSVDDLPRKLAINPPPPYPAEAVAARQEGTATLRVAVSADGRVTAISIYTSSGVQSLDDSALATVRRWVFAPAQRSGRAVPFEILVPIDFSIRRQP